MTASLLPSIFTIEIGDTPTLTFEAQNLREAHELCHEQWLKDDLAEAKSNGVPLWDGKAKLRARVALPEESVLFAEAKNNGQPRSQGSSLGTAEAGEGSMTRASAQCFAVLFSSVVPAGTNPAFPRLIPVLLCGAAMN